MAINLDKAAIEKKYFYEENAQTFGPFSLSALLPKINASTLIYREGIKWQKASELNELAPYFKTEKIFETASNNNDPVLKQTEIPKKKSGFGWFFLLAIVPFIIFFWNKQLNNDQSKEIISPVIDTIVAPPSLLSDFELFNINLVRTIDPTVEQKAMAANLFEQAMQDLNVNKNTIVAINGFKESLKNNPLNQTYFELANAYLQTSDFERCEKSLQMAYELDYQPKSTLDYKLAIVQALQGKFDIVSANLNNLIITDKNLSKKIEKDSLLYGFRQSEYYLSIIEKDAQFETESEYSKITKQYFEAIDNNNMNAYDFFSENVNQFINLKNTTPEEINNINSSNQEYINPRAVLIGGSVINKGLDNKGNKIYICWVNLKVYRESKASHQECRVKIEFIFDNMNKIISYKELEVRDLKFIKV
jgi:hypothetical protein